VTSPEPANAEITVNIPGLQITVAGGDVSVELTGPSAAAVTIVAEVS
jgi:hypothetical protein